jgi:hypothetical protein
MHSQDEPELGYICLTWIGDRYYPDASKDVKLVKRFVGDMLLNMDGYDRLVEKAAEAGYAVETREESISLEHISPQELVSYFDPSVHQDIVDRINRFKATHVVVVEDLELIPKPHHRITAVVVGPNNTWRTPKDAVGKWIGDLPSQRLYPTKYATTDNWPAVASIPPRKPQRPEVAVIQPPPVNLFCTSRITPQAIAQWLESPACKAQNIRPCVVGIAVESNLGGTWPACEYTQNGCLRIYAVGELPKLYKGKGNVCFTRHGVDVEWFVSSYYKPTDTENVQAFQPFGANFLLSPWIDSANPGGRIDDQDKPYKRYPLIVQYLE